MIHTCSVKIIQKFFKFRRDFHLPSFASLSCAYYKANDRNCELHFETLTRNLIGPVFLSVRIICNPLISAYAWFDELINVYDETLCRENHFSLPKVAPQLIIIISGVFDFFLFFCGCRLKEENPESFGHNSFSKRYFLMSCNDLCKSHDGSLLTRPFHKSCPFHPMELSVFHSCSSC